MNSKQAWLTVFNVLMAAAAVKAALTTLSRPMSGSPATRATPGTLGGRLRGLTVEDLEGLWDYDYDPRRWERDDSLDYEDLL